MKRVGITQRVEIHQPYKETRDALDQRWIALCVACGLLPMIIPNHLAATRSLIEAIPLDGFILSGGNSLTPYGGDAPERDQIETLILNHAITYRLPVLGVCRGMQCIQHFFGIPLIETHSHVNQEHVIFWENRPTTVNSYHCYGSKITTDDLEVLAKSEDGIIEAIAHRLYPIVGIMWHPERNNPFAVRDKTLLTQLFNKQ